MNTRTKNIIDRKSLERLSQEEEAVGVFHNKTKKCSRRQQHVYIQTPRKQRWISDKKKRKQRAATAWLQNKSTWWAEYNWRLDERIVTFSATRGFLMGACDMKRTREQRWKVWAEKRQTWSECMEDGNHINQCCQMKTLHLKSFSASFQDRFPVETRFQEETLNMTVSAEKCSIFTDSRKTWRTWETKHEWRQKQGHETKLHLTKVLHYFYKRLKRSFFKKGAICKNMAST